MEVLCIWFLFFGFSLSYSLEIDDWMFGKLTVGTGISQKLYPKQAKNSTEYGECLNEDCDDYDLLKIAHENAPMMFVPPSKSTSRLGNSNHKIQKRFICVDKSPSEPTTLESIRVADKIAGAEDINLYDNCKPMYGRWQKVIPENHLNILMLDLNDLHGCNQAIELLKRRGWEIKQASSLTTDSCSNCAYFTFNTGKVVPNWLCHPEMLALIYPGVVENNIVVSPRVELKSVYIQFQLRKLDLNDNYLGVMIFAVRHNGHWYNEPSNPFNFIIRKGNRRFRRKIQPGYIIMEKNSIINNFSGRTPHQKLIQYFFGKSLEDLQQEGIEFLAAGFSYQAEDTRSGKAVCDFKFKSTTFNAGIFVDGIRSFADEDGSLRTLENYTEVLLRLGIYNFWQTGNRVTQVKDVLTNPNLKLYMNRYYGHEPCADEYPDN